MNGAAGEKARRDARLYATTMSDAAASRLWLAEIGPAQRSDWIERHTPWLSDTELARLQRIARPERRAQLLAGHVLLRRLVAACAGGAAPEVEVRSLPDGRPELIAPAGWRASLAHSKRWVAALLDSGTRGAGVDIELMRPGRQIETIVKLACSVDAQSPQQAYLLWTQREAQIKAGSDAAGIWVTTWARNALAACASAAPEVALVDLATDAPPRPLRLAWTACSRLRFAQAANGN